VTKEPVNIAFDIVQSFLFADDRTAGEQARIADLLRARDWIPILLASENDGDILAGAALLGSLPVVYFVAEDFEAGVASLEASARLSTRSDESFIVTTATSMKAMLSHPANLRKIPEKYHERILRALEGPWFTANFDRKCFEKTWAAHDRWAI